MTMLKPGASSTLVFLSIPYGVRGMDNDFDWACRRLARLAPLPVLTWLLTSFPQYLRFVNWLDTRTASLPGVPQGIRDTIAELRELLQGRAWVLLLEFQGQPDPDMFGRLLIYLGTAWLELRPERASRQSLLPGRRGGQLDRHPAKHACIVGYGLTWIGRRSLLFAGARTVSARGSRAPVVAGNPDWSAGPNFVTLGRVDAGGGHRRNDTPVARTVDQRNR